MSNKTNVVIDFLTSSLLALNVTPDEESQLFITSPNGKKSSLTFKKTVNKKTRTFPIYLPTEEMQKGEHHDKFKYFPFAENMFIGNSEMLNVTIHLMNARLHQSTFMLLKALIQTKLDSEDKSYGGEVISALKGLGIKKTLGNKIMKLLTAIAKSQTTSSDALVKMGIDRKPEGKAVREGYIKLINTERETIFGENPDQQVRDILSDLLTNIFGDLKDYYAPTMSRMCPSYFALLKSFAMAADRINLIAEDLGVYKNKDIFISLDGWADKLTDEIALEEYHSRVITAKFPGNIGIGKNNKTQEVQGEKQVASRLNLGRDSMANAPARQQEEVVSEQPVEKTEEYVRPSGFRLGGVRLEDNPDVGVDLAGNPTRPSLGVPKNMHQAPAPRQQFDQHGGFNQSNSNQNLGFNVIAPKNSGFEREVHLRDARGNALFWQNGEPYMARATTDTIDGMVWAVDNMGYPCYRPNGEPELIRINTTQQNTGLFGNQLSGNQQIPQHNFPSQQELSRMPYEEQAFWRTKINEAYNQNQQAPQQNSFSGGGLFNKTFSNANQTFPVSGNGNQSSGPSVTFSNGHGAQNSSQSKFTF